MECAQYIWPEAVYDLQVLEYKCVLCEKTAGGSSTLKEHINGKLHIKKLQSQGLSEDPSIIETLGYYEQMEAPLREEAKRIKDEKNAERFRALAESGGERKRSLQSGDAPVAKKPKFEAYACPVCKIELKEAADLQAHFWSAEYRKKAQEFVGGCMVCGVPASPDLAEHFQGKKHSNRIGRLVDAGVDLSQLGFQNTVVSLGTAKGGKAKGKGKGGVKGIPAKGGRAVAGGFATGATQKPTGEKGADDIFYCGACKVELSFPNEVMAHFGGQGHQKASMAFVGGCAVCGVPAADAQTMQEHFAGKKHTKKAAKLHSIGLNV